MKEWHKKRDQFTVENLLAELRETSPYDFRNFMRMNTECYDELLNLVTPIIQKEDTQMRKSISPQQRLSVTLRYLATGNSFEDLKFSTAISAQSIGVIVIETCLAIIKVLKNYIKVFNFNA